MPDEVFLLYTPRFIKPCVGNFTEEKSYAQIRDGIKVETSRFT
jgi:hypothetical protein